MIYESVSNIIRLHTYYHNDQCRYYPTLSNLRCLFDLIEKEVVQNSAVLPSYLRITPFYANQLLKDKKMCQGALEEYMFYLECSENVTNEMLNDFRRNCYIENDSFGILNKKIQESLFFLVDKNDPQQFIFAIESYYNMLEKYLIPQMYKYIKKASGASEEEMCLGEFLFEIHCN